MMSRFTSLHVPSRYSGSSSSVLACTKSYHKSFAVHEFHIIVVELKKRQRNRQHNPDSEDMLQQIDPFTLIISMTTPNFKALVQFTTSSTFS